MKLFYILLLAIVGSTASAQIRFTFDSAYAANVPAGLTVDSILYAGGLLNTAVSGVALRTDVYNSTGYSGATGGKNITGPVAMSTLTSSYSIAFEVVFRPQAGYDGTITGLSFGSKTVLRNNDPTSRVPHAYDIYKIVNNTQTLVGSASLANYGGDWELASLQFSAPITLQGGTPLRLQIRGKITPGLSSLPGQPTPPPGAWHIDDLVFNTSFTLPSTLTLFSALMHNERVQLRFVTTNETNLAGYEVQRSRDGIDFSSAGWLPASGDGRYLFEEPAPQKAAWYRIKIVDRDQRTAYSQVLKVQGRDKSLVTVSPNPAQDIIRIDGVNADLLGKQAVLTDLAGRAVLSVPLTQPNQAISIGHLAKGTYLLKVGEENAVKVIRQ